LCGYLLKAGQAEAAKEVQRRLVSLLE
jgi:hypothetical protein